MQEDAERVLRTLSTVERTVESSDNDARYIMRMMPYRTVDNVISGVVITFVDITRITAAETRIGELTATCATACRAWRRCSTCCRSAS